MFGLFKKKPLLPKLVITVETKDNYHYFEQIEGGRSPWYKVQDDILTVDKTDGLKAVFPMRNVLRVEETLE